MFVVGSGTFEKLTYLYCVEPDGHDVTCRDRFSVLCPVIIAPVAQLSIIKCPSICRVAECLLISMIKVRNDDVIIREHPLIENIESSSNGTHLLGVNCLSANTDLYQLS